LCHGLCHNPAIPTRVGPSLRVSLGYTQKAVSLRETRMNTASSYRLVSLASLPYQATRRFDTEEVAGSNPVVPTIFINYVRYDPFFNLCSDLRMNSFCYRDGSRTFASGNHCTGCETARPSSTKPFSMVTISCAQNNCSEGSVKKSSVRSR